MASSLPPAQQGSRAGLITSLVIFVILWGVSTFFAMHFHTEWQAEIKNHDAAVKVLEPAVTADILTKDDDIKKFVASVDDAMKKGHTRKPLLVDAIAQRNAVNAILAGGANANADADTMKDTAFAYINTVQDDLAKKDKENKITLNKTENILANQAALVVRIGELVDELAAEKEKVKAANDANAALEAGKKKDLDAKDAELAKAKQDIEAVTKEKGDIATGIEAKVKALDDSAKAETGIAQAAKDAATAETETVRRDLKLKTTEAERLKNQLDKFRLNPSRALLKPAGEITRVPGNNTVFINLGEGKEIFPGLTFEVYDKKKGLPPLTVQNPDAKDDLLPGKASIEVVRILGDTSECRIIKLGKGMTILEGDLILNLIYNTHTKFAFYVYGAFDVGNTGPATLDGRDVLRHLVTQWGAKSMDHVGIETDFVVLGKEVQEPVKPENPSATDEEKFAAKMKEYQDYENVRKVAGDLHIPILNQNRFLYMIGYYDQKNR